MIMFSPEYKEAQKSLNNLFSDMAERMHPAREVSRVINDAVNHGVGVFMVSADGLKHVSREDVFNAPVNTEGRE